MSAALEPENPLALEDFLASRDGGARDELVNTHVLETGKFFLHASMPEVSIWGADGIGKCDRVRRVSALTKV